MFKRLAEDIGGPIVTVGIDILQGDINHKVDEDNKKEEKKRKEQEDEKRKAWEKARRERGETTGGHFNRPLYHTPSATRGERFYNERHKDHFIPQSEQSNNMKIIQLLLGGILLVLFLG